MKRLVAETKLVEDVDPDAASKAQKAEWRRNREELMSILGHKKR